MFKYLKNSYTAKDGGVHSAAVALVSQLRVLPPLSTAYVEVSIFHDLSKVASGIRVLPIINYEFILSPPVGKHDFAPIFTGTNDALNLFNYIKSLPEFIGWSEV